MGDLKYYILGFCGAVIAVLVLLFILIAVPATAFNYFSCERVIHMGLKATWDFWGGCFIHSEKAGWLPYDQYFQFISVNILK